MKSVIEIRQKLDSAIDDYLTSRLDYSNKQSFSSTDLAHAFGEASSCFDSLAVWIK